jgi:hypothetical protein
LALTSPTGGGRSVGIVRSRTKATEFSLVLGMYIFFYGCTVHLDNIKITFTNECTFYLTYEMLKFTIKTSIHSPLHVSVHLDHLQGAYGDPC